MQVRRLIFREMGTYNDMPVRPFNPTYKPRHRDLIMEATLGGADLSPGVLSGIAGQIMRPSTAAEGVAPIENGWGEKRLMFIMEVVVRKSPTAETLEMLTGYTDHAAISTLDSRGVKLDPDMKMYFSGRFEVMTLTGHGRHGPEIVTNIREAAHVLTARRRADLAAPRGTNGTLTARPEDLFVRNTVPETLHGMADDEGFRDMRAGFVQHAMKLSRRTNTQSSHYLSNTLKAYRVADENNYLDTSPPDDAHRTRMLTGRTAVVEPNISVNTAFEHMKKDSNIFRLGYITYGELTAMNPDLDKIADVFTPLKGEVVHHRGDSHSWGDRDNETIAATIVSNTIPTFLMDLMYSEVRFVCSNNTAGGIPETKVARLLPFMHGAEIDDNFHQLVHRIETQLLPEITMGGQMVVDLEVWCAINGDTRIWISMDGDHEREFVFPTFCESVASPMLTDRPEVLDVLSRDIGAIANSLANRDEATPSIRPTMRGKTL